MRTLFPALLLMITVSSSTSFAQVGIGTNTPNTSAALDVSSTSKAFLPPRMSNAQIKAIPNPTGGMIVYDNDAHGLRVYNGASWQLLVPRNESFADAPGVFGTTAVTGTSSLYSYFNYSGRTKIGPNKSLYFVATASSGTVNFGSSSLNTNLGYFSVFAKMDSLGNPLWMKAIYNTVSATNQVVDFDLDAAGNIYLAGALEGTADFDPGTGTATLTSNGSTDGYYAKYDADGNYVWAKRIGGNATSTEFVRSIVTDGTSVYLMGSYYGTTTFLTGTLTSIGSNYDDVFVERVQASDGLSGSNGWVRTIGGSGAESAIRIKLYAGSILVGGTFSGTCSFGTINKTSAGGQDMFFAIYNSFGTTSSVNQMGGTASEYLMDMTTDANGKIYLCGYFTGTTYFGSYSLTSAGYSGFVAVYNNTLTPFATLKVGGTSGFDQCVAIAVDAAGEIFVGGTINSTDYNVLGRSSGTTTGLAAFMMKLSNSLSPQWIHYADCATNAYSDFTNGIEVTPDGKLVFSTISMGASTYGLDFDGSKIPTPNFFAISRYVE